MAVVVSASLALLFLGLPFYWGAFGHHGFLLPIAWAVMIAVLVSLRHWRHLEWHMIYSFGLTFVLSLVACTFVYEVGHVLSR